MTLLFFGCSLITAQLLSNATTAVTLGNLFLHAGLHANPQTVLLTLHACTPMQVDATILQLLMTHAAWPTRSASTHDMLRAHGADAVDVLAAAAQASSLSGLFIGLAHQAHMALLMVQGQLAGQRIQVLLAAEAGTQDDGSPGAAEGAESSAAAASSTVTGLPQQPDPAISAEAELDYVLEVALHLVSRGTALRASIT